MRQQDPVNQGAGTYPLVDGEVREAEHVVRVLDRLVLASGHAPCGAVALVSVDAKHLSRSDR